MLLKTIEGLHVDCSGGADGLVFVIKRRLAGDIALQLAGQIDSRLGRKPIERRRLVELIVRMLIQARTDRVEEVVAGMGDAFYHGLIGVRLSLFWFSQRAAGWFYRICQIGRRR